MYKDPILRAIGDTAPITFIFSHQSTNLAQEEEEEDVDPNT